MAGGEKSAKMQRCWIRFAWATGRYRCCCCSAAEPGPPPAPYASTRPAQRASTCWRTDTNRRCRRCAARAERGVRSSAAQCKTCRAGKYSVAKAVLCTLCARGKHQPGQGKTRGRPCKKVACRAGWYHAPGDSSRGCTSCLPCPQLTTSPRQWLADMRPVPVRPVLSGSTGSDPEESVPVSLTVLEQLQGRSLWCCYERVQNDVPASWMITEEGSTSGWALARFGRMARTSVPSRTSSARWIFRRISLTCNWQSRFRTTRTKR